MRKSKFNKHNNFINSALAIVVFVGLFLSPLPSSASSYQLNWINKDNLPIEVELKRAPKSVRTRVSEYGTVTPNISLPIRNLLPDGLIQFLENDQAYLYIFIKNLSSKLIKFAVAPHSTEPSEASLGFSFDCLCKGHIYELNPKSTWYRIMSLTPAMSFKHKNSVIKLDHIIFKVNK
jgi:hypothetical protein